MNKNIVDENTILIYVIKIGEYHQHGQALDSIQYVNPDVTCWGGSGGKLGGGDSISS